MQAHYTKTGATACKRQDIAKEGALTGGGILEHVNVGSGDFTEDPAQHLEREKERERIKMA